MKIAPAAYLSPNFHYDPLAQVVIFERLNPDTGEITFQAPSRATLRDEARAAAIASHDHAPPAPRAAAIGTTAAPVAGSQSPELDSSRISILV